MKQDDRKSKEQVDHVRDLKIYFQSFSSINNHNFRGIKSMQGLHKAPTFKNLKYENRTNESNLLRQGRQENLHFKQDIKNTGINLGNGNSRLKKMRINQLAQFQSNGTKNRNTLGAIKKVEIIEKMVEQSKFFYKNVRPNIQDAQQTQQEQHLFEDFKEMNIADGQKFQKQNSNPFSLQKRQINYRVTISKEQIECTRKLDSIIVNYLCSPIDQKKLIKDLNQTLKGYKGLSRLNYFHIFLNILTVKVEESTKGNISVLQLFKSKLQKDYYLLCVNSQNKLVSYVNIRCRKLIQIQNYSLSSFQLDASLSFWCKSFMMFLTGPQNSGKQLIRDLNSQGFTTFASAVQCFYAKQPILQSKQLKASPLYGDKIFYRILLKVLLQQKFDEDQNKQVSQEEKQLITLLKLYHLDFYYRTIQFAELKEKLYQKLFQDFQSEKMGEANKTMQKIIGMLCLDQMYFQIFSQNEKKLSYLQRLLVVTILLENKDLLIHTRIDRNKWAFEMVLMVRQVVVNTNLTNAIQMNKIAISSLKICQKLIPHKQFQTQVVQILASNRIFTQNLVNQKVDANYAKIITEDLSLPLLIIDEVTFQSVKKHRNCFHFIKTYFAKYICVVKILEKDLKKSCNSFKQMQTMYFSNHLQNKQSRPIQANDQMEDLRQKNHIFQLGLICLNQLIFHILSAITSIQKYQLQQEIGQNQIIVRKVKQLMHKIKISLTQNLGESQGKQQLMLSSKQKEREVQLQRFWKKIDNLLEINDFTVNLIYLHYYLSSQDVQYLSMSNQWLANLNKKGQTVKVSIHRIFQDMLKYKIIDVKEHIWLLNEYFKKLMLLFKNRNLNQSRKRDPHSISINVGLFVNFIADCIQIVQSSSVKSEIEIQVEAKDFFQKSIIWR